MITTNTAQKFDIPHEENQWMELRKLTWRQLEEAREISSNNLMSKIKDLDPDKLQAFMNLGESESKEKEVISEQAAEITGQKYDKATVLKAGIVKWSYEEEVNEENVDALDSKTADWVYNQIIEHTEGEDSKNASAPST